MSTATLAVRPPSTESVRRPAAARLAWLGLSVVVVLVLMAASLAFGTRVVSVGEILGGLSAGDRIVHRGAILLLNSLSLVDDDDDSSKPAPAKPSPGEVKP